ncbi:hypothetical protein FRC02_004358 [Tulasnella sp. 418]|nr:hypothetical protein FRC02_004358 [Tulasnella sp. 418]
MDNFNIPFETPSKKVRKPTASKPTDISTLEITFPHLKAGPPSKSQPLTNPLTLSLAVEYILTLDESEDKPTITSNWFLLHPEENEYDGFLHPIFARLSVDSNPSESEIPPLDSFYYDTSNSVALHALDPLTKAGYLEVVPERKSKDVLVKVLIPDKGVAKKCRWCDVWEQRTDKERLAVCSGCRKAWYCDEECQKQAWKYGRPIPHKKICKLIGSQNPP